MTLFIIYFFQVTISASCQFFLRKEQLPYLLEQYDINYEPVLNKNALDALKVRVLYLDREKIVLLRETK